MLAVVAGIAIGLYSITLFSSSAPPIGSKANPAVAKLHPDDSARVVSIQSQLTALQKDRHAADTSLTDQIDDNSKMLAQAIDQLRESQTALDVEDRFDKISKELDMLKNKSAKSGNEFANMTKQIKALAGTIASQLTNSSIQMEKSQANLPEQMKEMQEKINKILQRSEELDDATKWQRQLSGLLSYTPAGRSAPFEGSTNTTALRLYEQHVHQLDVTMLHGMNAILNDHGHSTVIRRYGNPDDANRSFVDMAIPVRSVTRSLQARNGIGLHDGSCGCVLRHPCASNGHVLPQVWSGLHSDSGRPRPCSTQSLGQSHDLEIDVHTSGFLVIRPSLRTRAYLERWYMTPWLYNGRQSIRVYTEPSIQDMARKLDYMKLDQMDRRCNLNKQYHEQGCLEWLYRDFPNYQHGVKVLDHPSIASIVHKDQSRHYWHAGPPMLHVCCRPKEERRKILQECLKMLQKDGLCWWYDHLESAPTSSDNTI
eukprot:TRINITY_DN12391_c1_g1_i7.p1 TRINITY_DN12391_c1_g1~~TRINITY_DN12391_c1_g1_i7.p1  ORF type:complete len:482 (+),score=64.50 TRINITY_DN12391_c1_g1_i7:2-1447(+)